MVDKKNLLKARGIICGKFAIGIFVPPPVKTVKIQYALMMMIQ